MLNYPNILAVTILCRLFVTGAVKQLALNGNLCFQLVAASLPRVVQGSVMASTSKSNSAAVRARLGHPVIDSDGHHVEYGPRIRDYIKDLAGPGSRTVSDRRLTVRSLVHAGIASRPSSGVNSGPSARRSGASRLKTPW